MTHNEILKSIKLGLKNIPDVKVEKYLVLLIEDDEKLLMFSNESVTVGDLKQVIYSLIKMHNNNVQDYVGNITVQ